MPSCRFRGWCMVKRVSSVLFDRYLLYTNLGFSVALTAAGDFVEQKTISYIRGDRQRWDAARTGRVVLVAGFIGGLASHYWFHYLERRIPGQSFKSVMQKVWLDQLIFSPLYTLFLFVSLDCLEKASLDHIIHEVHDKALFLFMTEVTVMPPLQAINFYFFKPKFRVIFDYVLSLFLSGFTSYVKYDFKGISQIATDDTSE